MNAIKIGIVEDDVIIAQSIIEMLTASGYNVTRQAKRYSEAIAMIEEEAPDLLLLDIKILGSMDGIEVARTVQKVFNIPYIFLTANTDFETIRKAKEVTPAAFLAKPVTRVQLHAAIEMALGRYTQAGNSEPIADQVTDATGVFVKQGSAFRRIFFTEVLYAESRDNYVQLTLGTGETALIRSTLGDFLQRATKFIQVHRSFAVAPDKVKEVLTDEVQVSSYKIPMSKTYRAALLQSLGIK